jgi:hypothetical protein
VVNETFAVVRVRAGAGVVAFAEPEPRDLIVLRGAEAVEDVAQELGARHRVALVNLVADTREVRAVAHEVGGDVVGAGRGVRVAEAAGVGGDRGEEAVGNRRRDGPAGVLEEFVNQLASGGHAGRNPVELRVAGVALVVVYVDEVAVLRGGFADGAEALEAGAVGGDDEVELLAGLGLLHEAGRNHKAEFRRDGVLIPDGDLLALVLKREGEADLGADAITIRADVADDADGLRAPDGGEDFVEDVDVAGHFGGSVFSSSSRMERMRLPRSTLSSR